MMGFGKGILSGERDHVRSNQRDEARADRQYRYDHLRDLERKEARSRSSRGESRAERAAREQAEYDADAPNRALRAAKQAAHVADVRGRMRAYLKDIKRLENELEAVLSHGGVCLLCDEPGYENPCALCGGKVVTREPTAYWLGLFQRMLMDLTDECPSGRCRNHIKIREGVMEELLSSEEEAQPHPLHDAALFFLAPLGTLGTVGFGGPHWIRKWTRFGPNNSQRTCESSIFAFAERDEKMGRWSVDLTSIGLLGLPMEDDKGKKGGEESNLTTVEMEGLVDAILQEVGAIPVPEGLWRDEEAMRELWSKKEG